MPEPGTGTENRMLKPKIRAKNRMLERKPLYSAKFQWKQLEFPVLSTSRWQF